MSQGLVAHMLLLMGTLPRLLALIGSGELAAQMTRGRGDYAGSPGFSPPDDVAAYSLR